MTSHKSRFWQLIDYRVRITIQDGRMLVGTFIAFDRHLNTVLADTEEFRRLKPKKKGTLCSCRRPRKRNQAAARPGHSARREHRRSDGRSASEPDRSLESPQDRKLDLLANGPGKATAVNRSGQVGNTAVGVEGMGMQQAPIGLGQPNQASMLPKA